VNYDIATEYPSHLLLNNQNNGSVIHGDPTAVEADLFPVENHAN